MKKKRKYVDRIMKELGKARRMSKREFSAWMGTLGKGDSDRPIKEDVSMVRVSDCRNEHGLWRA